jgi:phosphatidylglycerophosphatase A
MRSSGRGYVSDRLAYVLSLWFGCGLVPRAPGTAGTLGAVPLYLLLRPHGPLAIGAAAIVATAVGVWASGRVAARLRVHDPQIVVIDEVAGFLVTQLGAPPTTAGLVAGFVLFRVLDQVKPFPARLAERRLAGGWGIVLDDLVAGAWAALLLVGARALGVLPG